MTLEEALANAARLLKKAEDAPSEVAYSLQNTADRWLHAADILLAREQRV